MQSERRHRDEHEGQDEVHRHRAARFELRRSHAIDVIEDPIKALAIRGHERFASGLFGDVRGLQDAVVARGEGDDSLEAVLAVRAGRELT